MQRPEGGRAADGAGGAAVLQLPRVQRCRQISPEHLSSLCTPYSPPMPKKKGAKIFLPALPQHHPPSIHPQPLQPATSNKNTYSLFYTLHSIHPNKLDNLKIYYSRYIYKGHIKEKVKSIGPLPHDPPPPVYLNIKYKYIQNEPRGILIVSQRFLMKKIKAETFRNCFQIF